MSVTPNLCHDETKNRRIHSPDSCKLPKFYFCFIDYAKNFDCVDHNKLENSERDGNTRPPNLPLEEPYAGQ